MVARIFFKRILPSMLLYYGAIQSYVVYHLMYGEAKIRLPNLPEIKPQESRKKMVEDILAMYHCKATSGNFGTIADDIVVEDASVSVQGKKNLMNMGFMLRKITKGETLSLKEHHYEDQFVMEMHNKYTFLGKEFEVPSVIFADLEGKGEDQRIKYFHDESFGRTLITPENTRFLFTGVTATFFRQMHGKLLNLVTFNEPK